MPTRLAVLAALVIASASLTSSGASAQNIDQYCKTNVGSGSRAVMLNRGDAYSWRCSSQGGLLNVSVDDLCRQQFGRGYRAVMLNRGDAYSWRCRR